MMQQMEVDGQILNTGFVIVCLFVCLFVLFFVLF